MKISRILVPVVALTATHNFNYVNTSNQATASVCTEACRLGTISCLEKCTMFGGFLPGGEEVCIAGCGAVFAGCMAYCAASGQL